MGSVPTYNVDLLLRAKRDDIRDWFDYYSVEGMGDGGVNYERSHDNIEDMVLNESQTKNYQYGDYGVHPSKG